MFFYETRVLGNYKIILKMDTRECSCPNEVNVIFWKAGKENEAHNWTNAKLEN